MRKNTPTLWDELWQTSPSLQADIYQLAKEEHSVRWKRIEKTILDAYTSFEGLQVIEIGAGAGTYSAIMAKRGASVSILDYSQGALNRSREFFSRLGLTAQFILQDALAMPDALKGKFDISMSFGLNEHFQGPTRFQISKAHIDVLKPSGLTFISVPNRYNPPYRLFKTVAELTNKWTFGEEYPYSRGELKALSQQLETSRSLILADSFLSSFDFINPFKALSVVRRLFRIRDNYDLNTLRPERGTALDSYLSYSLVLFAQKKQV